MTQLIESKDKGIIHNSYVQGTSRIKQAHVKNRHENRLKSILHM